MTVLSAAAVLGLILSPACGNVSADNDLPQHLVATVMTESGGDPFIIGINADVRRGLSKDKVSANSAGEAAAKAEALIAQGRDIDFGLAQINLHQLARHHLTPVTAFDQCANIRAGAEHLTGDHNWILAHRRYNCGGITCGAAYAASVTARLRALDGTIPVIGTPSPPPPCGPAWDAWRLAACSNPTGTHNQSAIAQETTHAN